MAVRYTVIVRPCILTSMPTSSEEQKARLKRHLQSLVPYPARQFAGTGIVICAGGPSVFTNAYVLIHLLRRVHGCRLPIEVWHFGGAEMSPRMKRLLRELEADTVDAEAVLEGRAETIENGWQLKACALMWSRFEQVLMLDADQVPLRDPSDLFEWQLYRDTGAVFWPDIVDILASNPIWEVCDLEPRDHPAIESGQLLIDKARHWRELQTAVHLNGQASYFYRMLYGDKDTFLIAALLNGGKFALVPHRPFSDSPFCLQQRDMEGRVLFQHRTGAKWRYAGTQNWLQGLAIEDECLRALAELRVRWNGLVFTAPARSMRAREVEAEFASRRHFTLAAPGDGIGDLEFLAEGEFGAGRSPDRMNWYCEEKDGAVELVFSDAFSATARLAAQPNGSWRGFSEGDGREIHLAARTDAPARRVEAALSLTEEILAAAGFPSAVWLDRREDILAALRLLDAVSADVAETLCALAARRAFLPEPQRRALKAIARQLEREPRDRDLQAVRTAWPMPGRYTTDPELEI